MGGGADSTFASDDGKLVGDHYRLETNMGGFMEVSPADPTQKKIFCATLGSRLVVESADDTVAKVRFLAVTDESTKFRSSMEDLAIHACGRTDRVNGYTLYTTTADAFKGVPAKRTGVSFGGLVIPFKYRLGGDKSLVPSASMAPYVGFRTGWFQDWGITITPIVAAGLALVPVNDSANNTTETKAGYTIATGFRLTSSKNDAFSAGIVIGRDYLNKSDRQADPNVKEPWAAIYLGYSL